MYTYTAFKGTRGRGKAGGGPRSQAKAVESSGAGRTHSHMWTLSRFLKGIIESIVSIY